MFDKISPLELMQFLVTPRGSKKDFEDAVEYLKEEYETTCRDAAIDKGDEN